MRGTLHTTRTVSGGGDGEKSEEMEEQVSEGDGGKTWWVVNGDCGEGRDQKFGKKLSSGERGGDMT